MATKKTTTAKKSLPIRSKDGKKLAGSVSLGGKTAPKAALVAKKATVKKEAKPKAPKKLSKKAMAEAEYQKGLAEDTTKYNVSEEVVLMARDEMEMYLSAITPNSNNFTSELSFVRIPSEEDADIEAFNGEIYLGREKIGSVVDTPDRDKIELDFFFVSEDAKKFWKDEVEKAYMDNWYERDDDYVAYLNSLTTPVTLDEFIESAKYTLRDN